MYECMTTYRNTKYFYTCKFHLLESLLFPLAVHSMDVANVASGIENVEGIFKMRKKFI